MSAMALKNANFAIPFIPSLVADFGQITNHNDARIMPNPQYRYISEG